MKSLPDLLLFLVIVAVLSAGLVKTWAHLTHRKMR